MGYAVRDERYRYVEWREWESDAIVARELYDHVDDAADMRNVAALPVNEETASRLSGLLRTGWQGALPDPDER